MVITVEKKGLEQRYQGIFDEEFLPQLEALYTFAYHLTYNEDDANDLVQDTYLKAWKFIHTYEERTNAKAWLFRILKNIFINEFRRKNRQPTRVDLDNVLLSNEDEDAPQSGFTDLRVEMFEGLIGDEVSSAINKLPVKFRVVILLCDIEGFTYEEISKILGLKLGTVRSRLFRARNLLKEELRKYAESLGYQDKR